MIIVDPNWTNDRLVRIGRDTAFSWLTMNGFKVPDLVFFDRESSGNLVEKTWLGAHRTDKGFSRVSVIVEDCPRGSRTGNVIHGPGSFEDYTPYGVLCHEVGHHVDYCLHPRAHSMLRSGGFKNDIDDEMEIADVEPNMRESFAEAIRLFITNPNLLEVGRPARWKHIRSRLKMRPLHEVSWKVVLSKASKVVLRSVDKWLEEGE